MGEVINLENMLSERIKELCAKNENYEHLLREIVKADNLYKTDQFGWQFANVPGLAGAHVNVLMQNSILKYGYKSNSATHFRLNIPADDLDVILDDVEYARLEKQLKIIEQEKNKQIVATGYNEEQVKRFEGLIDSGTDMLAYWSSWINPKIEGLEHVKKALLLSIASHGDKFGDRGRVHVLMHGDPGSAKSALKDWVVYQLGAESCSQRTSKVGLTGCATGKEITPGALARANERVLCIDELDKFAKEDRQSLLESMEEGVVLIEAGGMTARFDAETRIIACANLIESFSPELLDRFDFKIEMKAPAPDTEKRIVCSILDHWFESKEGYDGNDLKAYIHWIKSFEPGLHKEVRDKAKLLIQMFIDLEESVRGSMRRKESILRVAFTIAKIHKRNVEVRDFVSAIKLLYPNLNTGKITALEQVSRM